MCLEDFVAVQHGTAETRAFTKQRASSWTLKLGSLESGAAPGRGFLQPWMKGEWARAEHNGQVLIITAYPLAYGEMESSQAKKALMRVPPHIPNTSSQASSSSSAPLKNQSSNRGSFGVTHSNHSRFRPEGCQDPHRGLRGLLAFQLMRWLPCLHRCWPKTCNS